MRKCKGIGEVAVMEVSQVVGVRTRARALAAVQKRAASEMQVQNLELSSRRLIKREKQGEVASRPAVPECRVNSSEASVLHCPSGEDGARKGKRGDISDVEVEVSFGENAVNCDLTESIRETSSSSNLRAEPEALESTTSSAGENSGRKPSGVVEIMPSVAEIEEFFAAFEKEEQRRFTEKYNYDTVKDIPLAGRYEWVKVTP